MNKLLQNEQNIQKGGMNMKLKRFVTIFLCFAMIVSVMSGCGKKKEETAEKGSVYYLNFKPEVSAVWEELAKAYTEETGVEMKVITAASGNYESTLKSEIAKKEAPTLFQINGPIGYQSWKDYCLDVKESKFYEQLTDKSLAIQGEDGGIYGVPYTMEGYGIIYNDAIMKKYINLDGAKIKSVQEVNSFEKLKEVAEDMQSKKEILQIKGVFGSTSLMPGEEWRWYSHLANIAIQKEYEDNNVSDMEEIKFSYHASFKRVFDLYLSNSSTEAKMLGSKSVTDSMAEFALGQVAMIQNGNWAWNQIEQVQGNVVKEENVKFLPIYSGIGDEKNQGLCIGTENYFAINKEASQENQKATIDFVNWLISSETGKDYMINKLGNIAPFKTFSDKEKPNDPLAKEILISLERGKKSIPWVFDTFPSQTFKDYFGAALLEYAQGTKDWNHVVDTVRTQWKEEKNAVKS